MRNNPVKAMGEYFEVNFPIHQVSAYREYIGHLNFPYLDREIDKQRQKADFYLKELLAFPAVRPIQELEQTKASYPYLTIIFDSSEKRNSALDIFKNSGLGVSQVYLQAITDYPYLQGILPGVDCPQARAMAERTITLSTSTFLNHSDLAMIIKKLKQL
jgi:dTDP-4-amino-4,6-dideoxygalactose transaminase